MTMNETAKQVHPEFQDTLKNWTMVALTFTFVALYGAALIGWLKPLADEKLVMRLEPIIFVIVGYYFGRLPGQQNEKTLKQEINRQTQRADASQHAKEQALQSREAMEERVKNVKATLSGERGASGTLSGEHGFKSASTAPDDRREVVAAAIRILNS